MRTRWRSFFFRTRSGFCEHYTSAFGELMRIEKIPTRMVVGYHGGEYNSYGGFYQINQSNAHAWDEVWVDEKREWRRVDPTMVITAGSSYAIAANEGLAATDDLSFQLADRRLTLLSGKDLPRWMRNGLRDFGMRRQEMEAQWDDWVFSYDPGTQDRLAQALGLGRYAWMALFAACMAVAGLAAAAVEIFLPERSLSRRSRISTSDFAAAWRSAALRVKCGRARSPTPEGWQSDFPITRNRSRQDGSWPSIATAPTSRNHMADLNALLQATAEKS